LDQFHVAFSIIASERAWVSRPLSCRFLYELAFGLVVPLAGRVHAV